MQILDTQKILGEALLKLGFTQISKIEINSNNDTSISIHGITTLETREAVGTVLNEYFKLSFLSFNKDIENFVSSEEKDSNGDPLSEELVSLGYSHLYFSF